VSNRDIRKCFFPLPLACCMFIEVLIRECEGGWTPFHFQNRISINQSERDKFTVDVTFRLTNRVSCFYISVVHVSFASDFGDRLWVGLKGGSSFSKVSFFCQTQRKISRRTIGTKQLFGTIDFHSRKKNTMEVNDAPQLFGSNRSSGYLPLCSSEHRNSYRFATTWGWVNYDRIFIFGWSLPLRNMDRVRTTFLYRNGPGSTKRKIQKHFLAKSQCSNAPVSCS